MGGATSGPVRLSFDPQLRVEFRAYSDLDAGLLLPCELDERLGLSTPIDLTDARTGAIGNSRYRTSCASPSTAA